MGAIQAVQIQVLTEVGARGAAPLSELPRRWPVTRAILAAAARRLVAEGLLARGIDPRTGRPDLLELTEAGRQAVARA
jgi:DNA-binding MarR family transcriptional regulator